MLQVQSRDGKYVAGSAVTLNPPYQSATWDSVMTRKLIPTPAELRKLLCYKPKTGKLFWRQRANVRPEWNSRYAGREAFTYSDTWGYKTGAIHDKPYRAHRVIWAMETGVWPVKDIDHINCHTSDNRMCNLREATESQNLRNRGAQRNNTSGFKGVSFDSRRSYWVANINVKKKRRYLGAFSTPEEAHAEYCKAAREMHGEFARTQ